jgi:hypothetical protein
MLKRICNDHGAAVMLITHDHGGESRRPATASP